MKMIYCFLGLFLMYSCESKQNHLSKSISSENLLLDTSWIGDLKISDSAFVYTINSSCALKNSYFERSQAQRDSDEKSCILSKLTFDYASLNELQGDKYMGNCSESISLFIRSTPGDVNDADVAYQTKLFINNKGIIVDSLIVYKYISYSEALTVKQRLYSFIKNSIYTLDIINDESGASIKEWNKYRIDLESGNIVMVSKKAFETVLHLNDEISSWAGLYHFNASNKDQIETSFDINIVSSDNVYISLKTGSLEEHYSRIKVTKMSDTEIELIFAPDLKDDMGVIRIERFDSEYIISGNPIYFINPGNDKMTLIKIK